MMEEDAFKDFLKKGMEQPSDDFTKAVLQGVAREEAAMEKVLTRHSTLEPSTAFTANLMEKVMVAKVLRKPRPILPLWLIGAAAIFMIGLCVGTYFYDGGSSSGFSLSLGDAPQKVSAWWQSYAPYLMLMSAGILGLLLLDQQLKRMKGKLTD